MDKIVFLFFYCILYLQHVIFLFFNSLYFWQHVCYIIKNDSLRPGLVSQPCSYQGHAQLRLLLSLHASNLRRQKSNNLLMFICLITCQHFFLQMKLDSLMTFSSPFGDLMMKSVSITQLKKSNCLQLLKETTVILN